VNFKIIFSTEASTALAKLQQTDSKKYQKVLKTLGLMETNLRHPSLKTHKYESLSGPNGEEIFEAYVENKTPAAFRVFWYYGSEQRVITILTITPHP
jgi:mRNA-degrading endonuclease RelE of RelBE toxin-antitoxin system